MNFFCYHQGCPVDSTRTGSQLGLLHPAKNREGEDGTDRGVQNGDAVSLIATQGRLCGEGFAYVECA